MTLRAYRIPETVDASSLPWVFEGERALWRHLDIVEVDGSIDGYPEVPVTPRTVVLPAEQVKGDIVTQTQARLDAFAQTRGYDGILSACTYAADPVPKFAAEGAYAVVARSQTWSALYALLDAVQAGTTPMPTGFADVEPLLPVLAWPV
jgi:hypothetical protein